MTRFILTPALAVLVASSMVATVHAGNPGKNGSNGSGQGQSNSQVKGSGGQSQVGNQSKVSGSQSVASKPNPSGQKVTTPTKFNGNSTFMKDYHKTHGTSFAYGTCYKGNCHDHWTYFCYSNNYGCYCYWCPYTNCYYYWYELGRCYYPISYFQYAPCTTVCAPVVTAAPVAVAPVAAAPVASTSSYTVPVTVQVTSQVSQGAIVANGVAGPVGQAGPPPAP